MAEVNLPIKIILQRPNDTKKNTSGGNKKIFDGYDSTKPELIVEQLIIIEKLKSKFFEEHSDLPSVAKIIMRDDAIAKSYKPNSLCSQIPIIGNGKLYKNY